MASILSKRFLVRSISMLLLVVLTSVFAHATHLRAGDIVATRVSPNSLQFQITITVYLNTNDTNVRFGSSGGGDIAYLDYGDGTTPFEVPEVGPGNTPSGDGFFSTYTVIDATLGIDRATFTIFHLYSSPEPFYTINYRESNRNDGVLNMDNSVNTPFYLETQITLDPYLGYSNTPRLLVPPIDRACAGVTWFHNPGAYDIDGDSLSYVMVVPFQNVDERVSNYRDPNGQGFYVDFPTGNEQDNGVPTFGIDAVTGTITWDAPGKIGEYNIAFVIKEWRKKDGNWIQIGFVRRDMQIIVDDCENDRPDLILPKDTCVVAGMASDPPLIEYIFGSDPNPGDQVKIEAFSEIFNLAPAQSPATYTPNPPIYQALDAPPKLTFKWNPICDHIQDQPYQVVFKITDKPANGGTSLATFKTWFIRVVAPEPKWKEPILDLSERSVKLEWEPYFCNEADKMQIWRRVDESPFVHDNCQTGMPEYLGYELINTVPLKVGNTAVTTYIDTNKGKGLAPGARYCYRLVAEFPLPQGGESYVSIDTCVGPIKADVPVITNVSVTKTGISTGEIEVKWVPPFKEDIDTIQFPPPYHYEIYRAIGDTRGKDSTNVTVGIVNGNTFLDQGINTEENDYNYSITGYSVTNVKLGNSAVASSVWLETKSQLKKIELSWSAFVPWSNQIPSDPIHELYRGLEGTAVDAFDLIAQVDVTSQGFTYLDSGQYNNDKLVDNQVYCYRVLTRGGYGNPKILTPLENFSQVICAQPGDEIPPCQLLPPLRANFISCDSLNYEGNLCRRKDFSNIIYWSRPEVDTCRADVSSYNIYAVAKDGDTYDLNAPIQNVKDTFYTDLNLLSFARCYKIAAVDRSGNVGELSEQLCIDNCPHYELPNVFTPNGDPYNETFSAYNVRKYINCGEGVCPIPAEIADKCARFVLSVEAKIYNRWGEEVYAYSGQISNEVNTIYIDWNGRDSKGNELAPAVYYYVAKVTFDTVYPKESVQTIKGWVHMIR